MLMPVPRPTIVLVHGAFANTSTWSKLIPLLVAKGFSVVAVHCPLSSLADDVAAAERVIGMQDAPEAGGEDPRAVFQSPSHAFSAIRGRGFCPGGSEPTGLGRVSGGSIRGAYLHFRLEKGRA